MELMAKEGDGKSATVECLMRVHKGSKLLDCYDKRTEVVRRLAKRPFFCIKCFRLISASFCWLRRVRGGAEIAAEACDGPEELRLLELAANSLDHACGHRHLHRPLSHL